MSSVSTNTVSRRGKKDQPKDHRITAYFTSVFPEELVPPDSNSTDDIKRYVHHYLRSGEWPRAREVMEQIAADLNIELEGDFDSIDVECSFYSGRGPDRHTITLGVVVRFDKAGRIWSEDKLLHQLMPYMDRIDAVLDRTIEVCRERVNHVVFLHLVTQQVNWLSACIIEDDVDPRAMEIVDYDERLAELNRKQAALNAELDLERRRQLEMCILSDDVDRGVIEVNEKYYGSEGFIPYCGESVRVTKKLAQFYLQEVRDFSGRHKPRRVAGDARGKLISVDDVAKVLEE